MLSVRNFRAEDKSAVVEMLRHLGGHYPAFDEWLVGSDGTGGKLHKALGGSNVRARVAIVDSTIAGICLSEQKAGHATKIQTLYVRPEFQSSYGIGTRLLGDEIRAAIRNGDERLYVTAPLDKFDEVGAFFLSFGFLVDGVAPDRYGHGKSEVVFGKTLCRSMIYPEQLKDFILDRLYKARGYDVSSHGHSFIARPKAYAVDPLGVGAQSHLIRFARPEDNIATVASEAAHECPPEAVPVVYTSEAYSPGELDGLESRVVDAIKLEAIFYPLHILQPSAVALLAPVRGTIAKSVLPAQEDTVLQGPEPGVVTGAYVLFQGPFDIDERAVDRVLWLVPGEGLLAETRLRGWRSVSQAGIEELRAHGATVLTSFSGQIDEPAPLYIARVLKHEALPRRVTLSVKATRQVVNHATGRTSEAIERVLSDAYTGLVKG